MQNRILLNIKNAEKIVALLDKLVELSTKNGDIALADKSSIWSDILKEEINCNTPPTYTPEYKL